MNNYLKMLLAATLLGGSFPAYSEVDFYVDVSQSFGGDKIAEVRVETVFDEVEDTNIRAGEGFGASIGTRFDFGKSDWNALLAVGYKAAGIFTDSGEDVSFVRYPLTGMVFYDFGPVQLGGGVTREISGKLDLDDGGGGTHDLEDATGGVVGLDFDIFYGISVGLRYTAIDYEFEETPTEVDGDNIAIVGRFRF